jgi:hypothetical protein
MPGIEPMTFSVPEGRSASHSPAGNTNGRATLEIHQESPKVRATSCIAAAADESA